MIRRKAPVFVLPFLTFAAQAQTLVAQDIITCWKQGRGTAVPHSIASAEALLALDPSDANFVAAATTMPNRVEFSDGTPGSEGTPLSLRDPFTTQEGGGPIDDPHFAVRVTGTLLVSEDADFSLEVFSADGFDFRIDGISKFSLAGDRAPSTSGVDLVGHLTAGAHSVELIGWDQGGQCALELRWAP
jgi:hypothetical protein